MSSPLTPGEALYMLESPAFDMANDEIMDAVLEVFDAYAHGTLEKRLFAFDPVAIRRAKAEYKRQRGLNRVTIDWSSVLFAAETDDD